MLGPHKFWKLNIKSTCSHYGTYIYLHHVCLREEAGGLDVVHTKGINCYNSPAMNYENFTLAQYGEVGHIGSLKTLGKPANADAFLMVEFETPVTIREVAFLYSNEFDESSIWYFVGRVEIQFSDDDITYTTSNDAHVTLDYYLSQGGGYTPHEFITSTVDVVAPILTANLASGTYAEPKMLTLVSNEAGSIYYTVDNTSPTKASTVYTTPILIDSSMQVRATTFDGSDNQSVIVIRNYVIELPTLSIDPLPGPYHEAFIVNLNMNAAGDIYYTTDGSEPTEFSELYTGSFALDTTARVRAIGIDNYSRLSNTINAWYTVDPVVTQILFERGLAGDVPATADAGHLLFTEDNGSLFAPDLSGATGVVSDTHVGPTQPLGDKSFWYDTNTLTLKHNTGLAWVVCESTAVGVDYAGFINEIYVLKTATTITLTNNDNWAMFYTTDGSIPNELSMPYSNPVDCSSGSIERINVVAISFSNETIYKEVLFSLVAPYGFVTPPTVTKTDTEILVTTNMEPGRVAVGITVADFPILVEFTIV